MTTAVGNYSYIFREIPDFRLQDYPLIADPWKLLLIIGVYLYTIYVYLPAFMAHRKPYSLKGILVIYNLIQIVTCCIMTYGLATSGWTTDFSLGCKLIGPPEDESSMRMAKYMFAILILKIVEMAETVFFILRKKYNQVSFLHVYHHVTTILLSWVVCKYYPGGMLSLPVIVNCVIHILMYAYYLLASFGPDMQKKLEILKSKLTTMQLIQFVFIILHSSQIFLPSCKVPTIIGYIAISDMFVLFYYFADFYKKCYLKKD